MQSKQLSYDSLLKRISELEKQLEKQPNASFDVDKIIQQSETALFTWRSKSNDFIANTYFFQLLHLTPKNPISFSEFEKVIQSNHIDSLKDALNKAISQAIFSFQFCLNHQISENPLWIELNGKAAPEADGSYTISGLAKDISVQKEKEAVLNKYTKAFEHTISGIAIGAPDQKNILKVNTTLAKMHGYTAEELEGKPISTLYPDEYKDDVKKNMSLVIKKGHHNWSTFHLKKDGTQFPVKIHAHSITNNKGETLYRIVNVIDISEQKKAEIEKELSENHYTHLFQNLNSNFAVHKIILDDNNKPVDYLFLDVNKAFEESTGLKANQIIGKTALELFPNTEQYWIDKFGEVALTGKSAIYENYSKELNKYYELKIYSPKKGLFGMLATDVTERSLFINQLKEAKQHFELLFELNPDVVNIIRIEDFSIINVNNGFTKHLGYSKEEAIGKSTLELNLWYDLNERAKVLELLEQKGQCTNYEAKFRCKNGRIITGIVSALIVDINGENHILSVSKDITKRKEIEMALSESEKTLKRSQKIAGIGTYKLDFKTGFWNSSSILNEIFGIDENYNKNIEGWLNLIHPDFKTIMKNYLEEEVIGKNSKFNKEYKIIRQNDYSEAWVHGKGELTFGKNGELLEMTGTILDITNRKKNELIIKKQNRSLQKLINSKDVLFSIIAHDLRSPVSTLVNTNQLITYALEDSDIEEASKWNTINTNLTKRTLNLLDNLLQWFRIQTSEYDVEFNQENLKNIIDETVEILEDSAKQKRITINNHLDHDHIIFLNKEITQTVLRNLISNAIKFTNNNGMVNIQIINHTNETEIIVGDTGVGILPEIIPSVFSIEQNKSTMGTLNEKGTGLGLSICKELVEAQGGNIWVESKINVGSYFHFTIPFISKK